jgi:NADPH2:quinone reductase
MTAGLPKTMKAAVVDAAGPPEVIHVRDVPVPRLTPNHVIIALEYASVGIWDAKQRAGAWGSVQPGTILGADGSGTIAAVGTGVEGVRVGTRVYSYSYGDRHGFHAQYVSVRAERVAPVPDQIEPVIAGAVPCVALTALPGLEVLKVRSGQNVLVFGASGGVGSLAVWLGSGMGATIIGTARPDAQDYVRKLGAAHAIDPHSSEREAVIKRTAPEGFDAACVTTSSNDLPTFLSHLRPRARFAYPNGVEPEPRAEGHAGVAFDAEMSHEGFERLNAAIGSRTIPLRTEVFALDDVAAAHRRIEKGHVIGKIVLRVA